MTTAERILYLWEGNLKDQALSIAARYGSPVKQENAQIFTFPDGSKLRLADELEIL